MFTFYSSCKTNVYSILQQWYLGVMYCNATEYGAIISAPGIIVKDSILLD